MGGVIFFINAYVQKAIFLIVGMMLIGLWLGIQSYAEDLYRQNSIDKRLRKQTHILGNEAVLNFIAFLIASAISLFLFLKTPLPKPV